MVFYKLLSVFFFFNLCSGACEKSPQGWYTNMTCYVICHIIFLRNSNCCPFRYLYTCMESNILFLLLALPF